MATQDDYVKTALRLPRHLHVKLQEAATQTGKSMNAEIIARLEQSLDSSAPALAAAVARLSMLLNLTDAQKITEQLRSTIVATHLRYMGELLLPRLDPSDKTLIAEIEGLMRDASQAIHSPEKLREETVKRMKGMRKSLEQMQHLAGVEEASSDLDEFESALEQLGQVSQARKRPE